MIRHVLFLSIVLGSTATPATTYVMIGVEFVLSLSTGGRIIHLLKFSKKENAKEEARRGMIESRKNQVEEIKEYQRIMKKYKTRESIRSMSNDILSDRKEKCKQGMRLLRKEGRLRKEKQRTQRNMDMLTEFGEYIAKSEVNKEYLEKIEPDIVQKINEKNRAEREKEIEKI